MEKYAGFVMLVMVLVFTVGIISYDHITGSYGRIGYRKSGLYGGGLSKAYTQNYYAVSRQYGDAMTKFAQESRGQAYLYANKDRWDCSFTAQAAAEAPFPCVFDNQKWCCVDWSND